MAPHDKLYPIILSLNTFDNQKSVYILTIVTTKDESFKEINVHLNFSIDIYDPFDCL